MPITADRCVPYGVEAGGRGDVYRCFNDDRSVGCFSLGVVDNVIDEGCSGVIRVK